MRVSVLPGNKTQGPSADGAQCTNHHLLTVPSTGFTCMHDVHESEFMKKTLLKSKIYMTCEFCLKYACETGSQLPICYHLVYVMEKAFKLKFFIEKDIKWQ